MAAKPYGELPLGQPTHYPDEYSPDLLVAIPRRLARQSLGVDESSLPFVGEDIWNAYELSWLNRRGLPQVATAEFRFPCNSPSIIESKSFKLYLNSLNQAVFADRNQLARTLEKDLASCAGSPVAIKLLAIHDCSSRSFEELPGTSLDSLEVVIDQYLPDAGLLRTNSSIEVDRVVHSHLFRSLCPVTAQPDWASVWVAYHGVEIVPESLLQYLVSYRCHQGFHEQCVEKIFVDLMQACEPARLTVGARFSRRGGLDINPVRSTESVRHANPRLFRQ